LLAVNIWGTIHGFATLLLEGQISHTVLDHYSLRQMIISMLNLLTIIEIDPAI
jgi:hypothetical protein